MGRNKNLKSLVVQVPFPLFETLKQRAVAKGNTVSSEARGILIEAVAGRDAK